MPVVDLLGQYDPERALDNNQTDLINMYLEKVPDKGKFKVVAYPAPGLTLFSTTGESVIRALYETGGVLYCVASNKFGSINSGGTFSQIGSNLSTSTGFAKIVSIAGGSNTNNQLLIIDGTNGYHYNIDTATATFPISDADFPQTCIDVTTQDDYGMVARLDSISWNLSNTSDLLNWDALDFASKISKPDKIVAIKSLQKKLWLLGQDTTEVWYNSGNADFPFEAIQDVFIHEGCAARDSVAIGSETSPFFSDKKTGGMIFLAKNKNGGYHIIRMLSFVPDVLSSSSIDYQIGQMSTVSDAFAYIYNIDGHEMYEITFPTAAKTFTCDLVTGKWFQRQSYVSAAYTRFLGNCSAFAYGKRMIGDYNSGKVYYLDSTGYTENSVAIKRQIVTPFMYYEGKRVILNELRIDVETGVGSNKTFTLEKTFDNGSTWTTVDTITIPQKGGRIKINRLGSSREGIAFRITCTDNCNFCILGFVADFDIGVS